MFWHNAGIVIHAMAWWIGGTVCLIVALGVAQQWFASRHPQFVYLPDDDDETVEDDA